ncbi:MAG: transcriptional repressor [Deltaproteobacteria bacterium]|nr:transcriptional repressor [Deltaproteobacteria bacterium]
MDLNTKKLRQTEARRTILEEIKGLTSHPTADEVYQLVRKRIPKVSLGTIYRNLEILSENGRIQKLEGVGTQRRYDGTTENHYHLRCVSCGRVIDLTSQPLKEVEKAISKLGDYEILSYKLELVGVCLSCKSEKQKTNNKSLRNIRKENA